MTIHIFFCDCRMVIHQQQQKADAQQHMHNASPYTLPVPRLPPSVMLTIMLTIMLTLPRSSSRENPTSLTVTQAHHQGAHSPQQQHRSRPSPVITLVAIYATHRVKLLLFCRSVDRNDRYMCILKMWSDFCYFHFKRNLANMTLAVLSAKLNNIISPIF